MTVEEDAVEVEASLSSGNSRAFRNHFYDIGYLDDLEKKQLIEMLKHTAALVVTLLCKDGSTQLRADQSHAEDGSGPLEASASGCVLEEGPTPSDPCIYIKTEHSPTLGQEQEAHNQFARSVLSQILKCDCPVICFDAKDFVKTVLQFLGDDGSWKHVADFVGLDPRIAAWLIDPSDAAPSFEDLVAKYLKNSITVNVRSTYENSSRSIVNQNVRANLRILYRLTMDLCSQLKNQVVAGPGRAAALQGLLVRSGQQKLWLQAEECSQPYTVGGRAAGRWREEPHFSLLRPPREQRRSPGDAA
ncbi:DNA polymerase nu [Rhynchonycteris naso]